MHTDHWDRARGLVISPLTFFVLGFIFTRIPRQFNAIYSIFFNKAVEAMDLQHKKRLYLILFFSCHWGRREVSQLIVCNSAWPEQGLPLQDLRLREAEKSGFSTNRSSEQDCGIKEQIRASRVLSDSRTIGRRLCWRIKRSWTWS